jgi:predicted RNase H-like nuclease (RuvC/YqgF family)
LPHKSEWNKKVQKYNKLTYDLNKKLSELEHNVRKFLDENQDVKRIYDDNAEANKKYPRYDSFKYELARKFYQQYRSSLIGNALADA